MAQPIKVMQIIARMNVGGPAVIVADLIRGLDRRKFEQILVTGYCDENEADYLDEVATDIKATRIAGLGRSISLTSDIRAFIGLIGLIKKFQPDVIHTHTAKAGVLGRLASILAGRRAIRIHTFHGHLLHGYFNGWKTRLVILIERVLAKKTDKLIAIGNQVRDDLLAVGIGESKKFHVIFPGLPEPKYFEKAIVRQLLQLEPTALYCIYVGRLTQIKRPDRLISVALELEKRGIDLKFLVAGEGELFEASKRQSQSLPIQFLGWRKDISELMAASDIAILTSDNEGIPLTLIQAAQASLPIVATNVGSISDIVVDQSSGYLTPPNAIAMADALEKLARDSQLRQMMGANGKKRAGDLFSLSRMIADHSALYQGSHTKN